MTRKLVMSNGDSPLAAESPWSRKLSAAGRAVAMGDGQSLQLTLDLGDVSVGGT
jgi:hypothetical protein